MTDAVTDARADDRPDVLVRVTRRVPAPIRPAWMDTAPAVGALVRVDHDTADAWCRVHRCAERVPEHQARPQRPQRPPRPVDAQVPRHTHRDPPLPGDRER